MKKNIIDFNTVLKFINIVILILTCYSFSVIDNNPYIDSLTLFLGILLSMQTHLALIYEKVYRNPFIILFTLYMILYFSMRIVTLTIYPQSHVFDRFVYAASDSNFSMIFILISNTFLYFGFFMFKFKNTYNKGAIKLLPLSNFRIYSYILIILIFSFGLKSFQGLFGFIHLVFSHKIAIILLLIYYVINKEKISKATIIGIILFILTIISYQTIGGSRGGIFAFINIVILVLLATKDHIYFSKKNFFILVGILPFLITILYFTYSLATFNRSQGSSKATVVENIEYAIISSNQIINNNNMDKMLSHIAGRIGYFDFSSEIIAHSEEYDKVLNFSVYSKSIIDNILTPGFDLFDQPKIANSLAFIYGNRGIPKKSLVSQKYQSDQIGIHGELYALFGYGSVFLFFIIPYSLSYLYNNISNTNLFMQYIYKYFLLYTFVSIINSFGIDWTLLYSFILFVSLHIHYNIFFKYKFR